MKKEKKGKKGKKEKKGKKRKKKKKKESPKSNPHQVRARSERLHARTRGERAL